ncbi:hypothetical protein DIS24_g9280 [Lasiodiplodia hormozganensis]|uniref:Uncharacterized protein n=1 Tax=Lasiodiplodia hormozganensis TaxID=869390 RepID=A0AA40CIU5_9PEZI|nr:hypothetical protein DIS24_g9280 [Lasiodiplodia hormozganensis]
MASVGYLRSGSGFSGLSAPPPSPSPPEENPSLRPAAAKNEDAEDNTGTAGNPGNDGVASPGAMARDVGGSSGEMSRYAGSHSGSDGPLSVVPCCPCPPSLASSSSSPSFAPGGEGVLCEC